MVAVLNIFLIPPGVVFSLILTIVDYQYSSQLMLQDSESYIELSHQSILVA